MKVESRSRSQQKKARNSLFPKCKTSIGNNSGSIEGTAVKFPCSMGFSDMADRVMRPPSLTRDRAMHAFAGGLPEIRRQSGYMLVFSFWGFVPDLQRGSAMDPMGEFRSRDSRFVCLETPCHRVDPSSASHKKPALPPPAN